MTTVEGRPRHAQRPARRRHADLQCERVRRHQQSFPSLRLNPGSPDIFDCTSRIVCAVARLFLQSNNLRLELAHLGTEGVVLGLVLHRACSASSPEANRYAGPCAKRPDARCTAPRGEAAVRPRPVVYIGPLLHDSKRYAAVNWRRIGLATTSGSGAGRSCPTSPWGLVATLLDPQGRRARLRPGHRVCLCPSVFTSTPYTNSTGRQCLGHVGREGFPRLVHVALRTPPMPNRVLKLAENYGAPC